MSGWDGFTVFGLDKKRVGGWGGGGMVGLELSAPEVIKVRE